MIYTWAPMQLILNRSFAEEHGITTMEDVLIDVRRVTDVTELPVLVDIDTELNRLECALLPERLIQGFDIGGGAEGKL